MAAASELSLGLCHSCVKRHGRRQYLLLHVGAAYECKQQSQQHHHHVKQVRDDRSLSVLLQKLSLRGG